MLVCASSLAKTTWKYIVFSYNQGNIEAANQLRQKFGLDGFSVVQSDRFDEHTDHLKPVVEFVGLKHDKKQHWRNDRSNSEVDPQCAKKNILFLQKDTMRLVAICRIIDSITKHRLVKTNHHTKSQTQP